MKRPARLVPNVLISALLIAACSKDDDLPPPIPLPTPPNASPAIQAPAHAPQAEQDPPKPWQPVPVPSATASAVPGSPSASADPTPAPSITPYAIPYPLPLPNLPSMPQMPQIPGLPSIPGLGSSAPVDPPIGEARVVIYGTRSCPACTRLKADLKTRRVPFDFIDLEDPLQLNSPLGKGSADMPATMRSGIPVTRVTQKSGKTVWVQGAEAAKIEHAYRA